MVPPFDILPSQLQFVKTQLSTMRLPSEALSSRAPPPESLSEMQLVNVQVVNVASRVIILIASGEVLASIVGCMGKEKSVEEKIKCSHGL